MFNFIIFIIILLIDFYKVFLNIKANFIIKVLTPITLLLIVVVIYLRVMPINLKGEDIIKNFKQMKLINFTSTTKQLKFLDCSLYLIILIFIILIIILLSLPNSANILITFHQSLLLLLIPHHFLLKTVFLSILKKFFLFIPTFPFVFPSSFLGFLPLHPPINFQ